MTEPIQTNLIDSIRIDWVHWVGPIRLHPYLWRRLISSMVVFMRLLLFVDNFFSLLTFCPTFPLHDGVFDIM